MTESEIYPILAEIFSDAFLHEVPLAPELTADDVDGWDSFKHIEIVIAVEQRFGVRFRTREIDGLHSVGDLVALIGARRDGQSAIA
ncbi:acyl carrier protein [Sphingomonas sp. dw_22]|uniref:acyl carrier protein n=1 Tax=Sphingomonas sp. dw_22 TaxID=2721175 RepID=UPI001BD59331|nr:acyl carrier protein [Sphingomonas sp. dw_22]